MLRKLSAPGNLLLLGEYAVLESGGLGLALAPDVRVQLDVEAHEAFALTGILGGKQVDWQPDDAGQPLLSALWTGCSARLQRYGVYAGGLRGRLRVDSSALYHPDGRKSGFGSSAAVSVAVATAVMLKAGLPAEAARTESVQIALEAHRRAQGGSGSGYDIYTSSHGAVGLFIGGPQPSWTALDLDWLPPLYLFAGSHSVSSDKAIVKYLAWKYEQPAAADQFLKQSNAAVIAFVEADSWDQARPHFEHYRELAIRLGHDIGVTAEITPPTGIEETMYKAVGAGNELGVALGAEGSAAERAELVSLKIAKRGVVWA
jgi:phosphomevalonate kinase